MQKVTQIFNTTFSSLHIRNYKLYFYGQIVSLSGTWMQQIAQGLLVLKLTGSGTVLGVVTALQFLPILLLGPLGGVFADRYPKRHVLYITQVLFGILATILGILVLTKSITVWEMYILALGVGMVNLFDNPTRQAFISEMVGQESLANAVSLNSSVINLARVIGPALAGILIATVGLAMCFILNGISYIPVIFCLLAMNEKELLTREPEKKQKGQLIEGLLYVYHNPRLLHSLVMMAVIGAFAFEFSVILPLFSQFTFHGDATTYTMLTCALGLGAVLGGLFTANKKEITSTFFVRIAILFGVVTSLCALMPTVFLACVALLFVGFFSLVFMASGNSLLQLESAPQMRGRVMSLWSMAFLGTTPIGGPIIGLIGEHSARMGLAVGGISAIIAGIYGFVMLRLHSRNA